MEYKENYKTYFMSSNLNKFQEKLYKHLIDWKKEHLTTEPGSYRGHIYDYLFPNDEYEFSPVLYNPLHPELRSLQSGKYKYKEHIMARHMASSQCACINLFMPILLDDNASEIIKHIPGCPEDFHTIDKERLYKGFCFEYWGQDIDSKPRKGFLLDHTDATGTDSDLAIAYINKNGERCIWLIEHKLAEREFTCCGGYNSEHNKHKEFCKCGNLDTIPEDNHLCRYTIIGYNYWEITSRHKPAFRSIKGHEGCPFLKGRNQLWRNHLLALQLMDSGSYTAAHFSVVHHKDNRHLDASMKLYRDMISPELSLTSFTNADVVYAAEKYGYDLTEWVEWYRGLYMIEVDPTRSK